MQFNMFEAGAVKTPPQKPVNPSIGYPSNGDLSQGEAPTQLGAYWVYQLSEEFTSLLKDNGFEPSPDDLHQLSKFFKNYKAAMTEIKEVAVEAGSGARNVLADMRQTQKEMIALKTGTADDLKKTRSDLEDTRNALSEVNSVLDEARTYTQKLDQYQANLDSSKSQIQTFLSQNLNLETEIKKDLNEIAKKQSAISVMENHVSTVKGEVDDIKTALLQKSNEMANTLSSVNETEKQVQSQAKRAEQSVETVANIKRDVVGLKEEAAESVGTIRSLGKQATDAINSGLASVKSVADGVNRNKEEARSYRDQAQAAAENAKSFAREAKNVDWDNVLKKPGTFPPSAHSHAISDISGVEEALEKASFKPKTYITETWASGDSWYRKYSDGWIEQGGRVVSGSSQTCTFPIKFKKTNYFIVRSYEGGTGNFYSGTVDERKQTKCSFATSSHSDVWIWYACGF